MNRTSFRAALTDGITRSTDACTVGQSAGQANLGRDVMDEQPLTRQQCDEAEWERQSAEALDEIIEEELRHEKAARPV